ncbi:MAG: hypothetical protein JW839_13140 [Candidatus Lokiarchaeota archaeon]|nr:hypothetical protein [Candidatus Lokiarchaeota archaeon]
MARHGITDEERVRKILERLENDLWGPLHERKAGDLDTGRLDAILSKLREELWAPAVELEDRDEWVNRVIDTLREDLWGTAPGAPEKRPSPEEEKRVEAILARLKEDLWSP